MEKKSIFSFSVERIFKTDNRIIRGDNINAAPNTLKKFVG